MSRTLPGAVLLAAAFLALPSTMAQPASSAAPARALVEATDPAAPVPPLNYRSAFTSYRPNVEQPIGAWREANDKVGRVGGWGSYATEHREPAAPAAESAQPAARGASAPAKAGPGHH